MNYRSRASFKILQIDDRFNIFHEGDTVVDLGACPGGWSQIARERVGDEGHVIAVDLRYMYPLEGVVTMVGDITDDNTIIELLKNMEGKADVVLSDMAPNIGGHYSTDHARSVELCMFAVDVCDRILRSKGKLVMKVFMGDMFNGLKKELESRFESVRVHSPKASRPTSSEVYFIAKGFKGNHKVRPIPIEKPEKKPEFKSKGCNI